jgi:predicted Zn-dependent protease
MFAFQQSIRKTVGLGLVAGATGLAACGISTQQEQQIGQQYSAEINSQLPIVDQAAANRYINDLGNRIARQGARQIGYRFYIVNSDVVNAFAVPGGYVYVNRGLVEATDNLSELAGVLAHEIGHVEERHSVEQMEKLQGANLGLNLAYILLGRAPSGLESAAINVGGGLYFASHSRQAENEADAVAVSLLVNAGINPQGLVTFFNELIAERNRRPSQLEQWFSTHPTTEDRVQNVERMIAQLPASQARGGQTNTADFQSFKSALSRYPAPPAQFRARN